MTKTQAPAGRIVLATRDTLDILDALAAELHALSRDEVHDEVVINARVYLDCIYCGAERDLEDEAVTLATVINALTNYAAPGMWFGRKGDDIGFWYDVERPGGCGAARYETAEATLVAAHKAGQAYWHFHRMLPGMREIPVANLAGVARSCGWHGRDCEAWLAGFHGARNRDKTIHDLERPGGCGAMRFPKFFSIDDGKAVKAQTAAKGWLNAINYMAPAATAGVGNLCPHASAGCKALCLGEWSGQAGMRREGEDNNVTLSRKAKAVYYMRERKAFMNELTYHIERALDRATAEGRRLCVRLNGSTDIAWERATVGECRLMNMYPDVQFVDYTKSLARMLAWCEGKAPANYHLTFSRSETNENECLAVLAEGGNVAVVAEGERPYTWLGARTIDGDKHDLRHLDGHVRIGRGQVVWLSPKGARAKRDRSGFVMRAG